MDIWAEGTGTIFSRHPANIATADSYSMSRNIRLTALGA